MSGKKRKILIRTLFTFVVAAFLAGIVLLFWSRKIDFNYQAPYLADNISLIFTNPRLDQDVAKLDFLLSDLKPLAKTDKLLAILVVSRINQAKELKPIINTAQRVYIDIFRNKQFNQLQSVSFNNRYGLKLPFEIRSYLTEDNELKIYYSAATKKLIFLFPGQNFKINQDNFKLNDFLVYEIGNLEPASILEIGDLRIDLENYHNNISLPIYSLIKNKIRIYQLADQNLLARQNYSFERGTWTSRAADCSAYLEGSPKISMNLIDQATEGSKSLELSSENHFACTYFTFPINLEGNKLYKLSFDYKSLFGNKVQYYYNLANQDNQVQEKFGSLETVDSSWNQSVTFLQPEIKNSNSFSLYLYAPSSGSEKIVNLYDNVKLAAYQLAREVKAEGLNFPQTFGLANWLMLAEGDNEFDYVLSAKNLLAEYNSSFERGSWTKEVVDCSNYLEGSPKISMNLIDQATEGSKSLELSSENHFACTYFAFPINLEGNKLYKLSFDYKSLFGNKVQYYYNLRNELGQNQDKFETIQTKNNTWNNFETIIEPQIVSANNFDLYLYAPSDDSEKIVNLYDNVKLEEFAPKEIYSYYLLAKSNTDNQPIYKSISANNINRWQTQVEIKGVSNSFLLVYPRPYNNSWKLYFGRAKIYLSFLPSFFKPAVNQLFHYQIDNYRNGWWVDLNSWCLNQNYCQKNQDGSYNISLIIENDWNRSFVFALIISLWFLLLALLLAVYEKKK